MNVRRCVVLFALGYAAMDLVIIDSAVLAQEPSAERELPDSEDPEETAQSPGTEAVDVPAAGDERGPGLSNGADDADRTNDGDQANEDDSADDGDGADGDNDENAVDVFVPSEDISEDISVPFPVDI